MRIGLSPTRTQKSNYQPARVTICILTYIPDQIGYFANRFNVLKMSLASIFKHTPQPYDIMVFDNGSCSEVVTYLRELQTQGRIRYLILSQDNIGILNALKVMFNAAPGEIIAYSQDDVLFHSGWLEAHLKVIDEFPRVGMVSGVPIRWQFRYGNQYLKDYLSQYPEIAVQYGKFIPEEWEKDFFQSVGWAMKDATACTSGCTDILLERKGLQAYSTATHFQYVTPKAVILEGLNACKWDSRLMGGEGPASEESNATESGLDERIDSLGYARLSTFGRFVDHIGNVITPEFEGRLADLKLEEKVEVWSPPSTFFWKIVRKRFIREGVRRMYNWLYFLLRYSPTP
ncbi:glycosyltransferase family A protein [Candidatus Nitronereus thalassa]|uniref:Glycosyltransferase family A protein n=1 Tax=Candidatus Nitronereus thalassa TaxID=3020898 RepID=A0ABU3K572_9BACT|nr:glycosyltransferase family A protein [Candidatus Nitronereus thalassa]MDT7041549.1 glycosyltransferase family A protein [Candidatus Nitronereus thalassa]